MHKYVNNISIEPNCQIEPEINSSLCKQKHLKQGVGLVSAYKNMLGGRIANIDVPSLNVMVVMRSTPATIRQMSCCVASDTWAAVKAARTPVSSGSLWSGLFMAVMSYWGPCSPLPTCVCGGPTGWAK